jgi:hypothetical protein
MKVYISNYRNHWYSPSIWFDYLFFWTDWSKCHRDKSIASALDEDRVWIDRPDWVERWSDRLVPVSRAIQWFMDLVHPKIDYVRIDRWDTWSMDSTLSPIVLPMLRQLQDTKHGAPNVDDEDVPENLRSTAAPPKENEWDTDANHFLRWDWVLDEMIFAFEMKCRDDWQSEFHSGESDILWVPVDKDGNEVDKADAKYHEMRRGPNDTSHWDWEGMKAIQDRISNGFRLFGKYFEALWD